MPRSASGPDNRPNPTTATAPITAHTASGKRHGRMMTPPVANAAIPQVAAAPSVSIDTAQPSLSKSLASAGANGGSIAADQGRDETGAGAGEDPGCGGKGSR